VLALLAFTVPFRVTPVVVTLVAALVVAAESRPVDAFVSHPP